MNILPALVVLALYCSTNILAHSNDKIGVVQAKSGKTSDGGDLTQKCNQTYQTKMDFMKELNDTGSFPDESNRTPMCFIKCVLEGAGILSNENDINKEKTIAAYRLDNDDLVDDCVVEMAISKQNDACEKAYYFVRCLMTRSLLDNLGPDNDSLK